MPGITRRPRIGIIDITDIENDENQKSNIRFCLNCQEAGAISKLGKRIYLPEKKGEPVIIPPDADEWLQCPACGTIIPKYEARGEGELRVDPEFELIESPSDFGQTVFESIRSPRKIDKTKLQLRTLKKLRQQQLASVDPDIRKELLESGTIESYDIIRE